VWQQATGGANAYWSVNPGGGGNSYDNACV
jgi:hypothetical protein